MSESELWKFKFSQISWVSQVTKMSEWFWIVINQVSQISWVSQITKMSKWVLIVKIQVSQISWMSQITQMSESWICENSS